MPIHDWTRASDAAFHSFQLDWSCHLSDQLNQHLLPSSYLAVTEAVDLRPPHGLPEWPEPDQQWAGTEHDGRSLDPDEQPPASRFRLVDDRRQYACRVVTVRDADTHAPVAGVLFVTRQDQRTPYRLDALTEHAVGAVSRGIHLLVVDMFPPATGMRGGVPAMIWERMTGRGFEAPADKPLTLAAYSAEAELAVYIEPVAVGDAMPDMPIFLTSDRYVPCPLEATYTASWAVSPKELKELLEAPPAS